MIHVHFGDEMFEDLEEDVIKLLQTETDLSCKRNSFLLLYFHLQTLKLFKLLLIFGNMHL